MFDGKQWIKFKIPAHTHDWYQFRTIGIGGYEGGIGASEAGKVLGEDPYEPSLAKLFYQKVGMEPIEEFSNEFTHWGQVLEPIIREQWKFSDGSASYTDAYADYKKTGNIENILRTNEIADYYLVNTNYAHLFISLDSVIPKGQPTLDGDEILNDCPLEIKTVSFWASQKWASGVDPKYVCQITQQMIVTESNYGEIAALNSGNKLEIIPFHIDKQLADKVIHLTADFWVNRVLPGRKLWGELQKAEIANDKKKMEEYRGLLQRLEPPAEASDAYKDYMKERYREERQEAIATLGDKVAARKLHVLRKLIAALEKEKGLAYNKLLKRFQETGTRELLLGGRARAKMGANKVITISKLAEIDKKAMDQAAKTVDIKSFLQ